MDNFFNFFSTKYFLILSTILIILHFIILTFAKHKETYQKQKPKREDLYFMLIISPHVLNAIVLLVGYIVTLFSKLEAGTSLGYEDEWWYLIRWFVSGICIWVLIDEIKHYIDHASVMEEKLWNQNVEIRELRNKLLEVVDASIKKLNKIEDSFSSNYKNKLDSYEKDYMNFIKIIESEEGALDELASSNPRIGSLVTSRELGDSKKFIEKKESIFSGINPTEYKKTAQDRDFDEFSRRLLKEIDEYKKKLSEHVQ